MPLGEERVPLELVQAVRFTFYCSSLFSLSQSSRICLTSHCKHKGRNFRGPRTVDVYMSREPGDGTEIWVLICERNRCCIAAAARHGKTSGCFRTHRNNLTPAHLARTAADVETHPGLVETLEKHYVFLNIKRFPSCSPFKPTISFITSVFVNRSKLCLQRNQVWKAKRRISVKI